MANFGMRVFVSPERMDSANTRRVSLEPGAARGSQESVSGAQESALRAVVNKQIAEFRDSIRDVEITFNDECNMIQAAISGEREFSDGTYDKVRGFQEEVVRKYEVLMTLVEEVADTNRKKVFGENHIAQYDKTIQSNKDAFSSRMNDIMEQIQGVKQKVTSRKAVAQAQKANEQVRLNFRSLVEASQFPKSSFVKFVVPIGRVTELFGEIAKLSPSDADYVSKFNSFHQSMKEWLTQFKRPISVDGATNQNGVREVAFTEDKENLEDVIALFEALTEASQAVLSEQVSEYLPENIQKINEACKAFFDSTGDLVTSANVEEIVASLNEVAENGGNLDVFSKEEDADAPLNFDSIKVHFDTIKDTADLVELKTFILKYNKDIEFKDQHGVEMDDLDDVQAVWDQLVETDDLFAHFTDAQKNIIKFD